MSSMTDNLFFMAVVRGGIQSLGIKKVDKLQMSTKILYLSDRVDLK